MPLWFLLALLAGEPSHEAPRADTVTIAAIGHVVPATDWPPGGRYLPPGDGTQLVAEVADLPVEDGAKAVEAGTRQFGEVTHAFRRIVGMMQNTTDAAREIELGARQQVTAVDQVNIALQNVTQAVRDAEASTRDTLETSTQLAVLSRNLIQLVKREAGDRS